MENKRMKKQLFTALVAMLLGVLSYIAPVQAQAIAAPK